MGSIEPVELLLRLGAAALLGGIVGLERELRGKPAGLRTVMLVSIGTAVFALLSIEVAATTTFAGYDATGDTGRVLQGVVAGIGVLGAGVFLHRDETIRLATTGASVWLAGAVGIACGFGLYLLAGSATALAILVLEGLGAISRRLGN
jgi:putative Mg2+ transporter-C (MgtC) family protein